MRRGILEGNRPGPDFVGFWDADRETPLLAVDDFLVLARYLRQPVTAGDPPRRVRIHELAVPGWLHVPGSTLRWADFIRATLDLMAIRRARWGKSGMKSR